MEKKLALILCLITMMLVGFIVFVVNRTIDFPTLFFALKIMLPAGLLMYVAGLFLGKIVMKSKGDTELLNSVEHQQFIDDLLLNPQQVLSNSSFLPMRDVDLAEDENADEDGEK